jgi:hypothetical protein
LYAGASFFLVFFLASSFFVVFVDVDGALAFFFVFEDGVAFL